MKEIQGNIDGSICSDNEYIRSEYNSIRLNITIVLRTLFKFDVEFYTGVKPEQLKEQDIVNNGTLDKLIREQRTSPDMATSPMNDSAFASTIQAN